MTSDGAGSGDQKLEWVRSRRDNADFWSINQWKNAGRWRQVAFWVGLGNAVVAGATFLFAGLNAVNESDVLRVGAAISGGISAALAILLSSLNPSKHVDESDRRAIDNADAREYADLLIARWEDLTPQDRDDEMDELRRKIQAARSRGSGDPS